jgi:Tfp pilus assembly protein PilF
MDQATREIFDRAAVFLDQGRHDRAIPLLREVVARDPSAAGAFAALAHALR